MVQLNYKNAVVITGGPGMGKTAIINHLADLGHTTVPEAGRTIIKAEIETGGDKLPWKNQAAFAEEMFRQAVHDLECVDSNNQFTFFDRGLPDTIGYLKLCKLPVPDYMLKAAEEYRYHPKVFITPPWLTIYENDAERKQSFSEAVATYEIMLKTYDALGYTVIELPKQSVEQRVRFIREKLHQ